jgi:hypothetical protein
MVTGSQPHDSPRIQLPTSIVLSPVTDRSQYNRSSQSRPSANPGTHESLASDVNQRLRRKRESIIASKRPSSSLDASHEAFILALSLREDPGPQPFSSLKPAPQPQSDPYSSQRTEISGLVCETSSGHVGDLKETEGGQEQIAFAALQSLTRGSAGLVSEL